MRLFRIKRIIMLVILIAAVSVGFAFLDHDSKTAKAATATGPIVCIDPGHGGDDPGAQSGNLTESDINLKVSFLVRQMLEAKDYQVVMTRTTDTTLSHLQRAQFCNTHHAAILVAVHQNFYTDGGPDYSTALYYKPQDLALATALAKAAGQELGLSVTPPSYFVGGVLMHSTMPATLIESLFISNNREANLIAHGERLDQQAQGIANGIVDYLNKYK